MLDDIKMKTLRHSMTALLFLLSVPACTTPYYGYSKEDWGKLTKDEQTAVKSEYELIVESRREQVHRDIIDARTQSVIDLGVNGPDH